MFTENHAACGSALNTCASEDDLVLRAGPKEDWGAEIRIYEEMCLRADDLKSAIQTAAQIEKYKDLKAAIFKTMETSFVAWAKVACEPCNNNVVLPIPS
ncbi:hypothetical protein MVEG_09423 [Podila verticillata NRRL 6337]|nr:hypothetical protein MVEG_09423 [Podila verticillata NRRL 6337]